MSEELETISAVSRAGEVITIETVAGSIVLEMKLSLREATRLLQELQRHLSEVL